MNGSLRVGIAKRSVQVLTLLAVWAALFFTAAGRLDVTRAWIYLAVSVVLYAINLLVVVPRNPEASESSTMTMALY